MKLKISGCYNISFFNNFVNINFFLMIKNHIKSLKSNFLSFLDNYKNSNKLEKFLDINLGYIIL